MSANLYTELKATILSEFKQTTAILENCELKESLVFKDLNSDWLLNTNDEEINSFLKSKINNFKKDVIYTVSLLDVKDTNKIIASFKKAKQEKFEGRVFSKLNTENIATNNSNQNLTLYVGSSKAKRIVQRMRCHLGIGSKTTYALQLKKWLPKSEKCNIKISFFEVSFPTEKNYKTTILELIEQALWAKEKPLLGKQSGLL